MIWQELLAFAFHPIRSVRYVIARFLFPTLLKLRPGVSLRGRLDVREFPIITVAPGGRLILGDGVKLNSRNEGYHLNMHSPVKLVVGKTGARIEIGDRTRVHGTCIHALEQIRIGKSCLIAANTQIIDSSGHSLSFPNVAERIYTVGRTKPVTIEDHVWIGANCIILPGVTIGEGSVIAAGSVVGSSIPPFVVAGGNPAVVLRAYRRDDGQPVADETVAREIG